MNRFGKRAEARAERGGFTLVEMLVAVALVLLMMTLFAQIFQMASRSLGSMKGMGENDQRVRLLTATIRNDINKRTFRVVTPLIATAGVSAGTTSLSYGLPYRGSISDLRGYFHLSEGDVNDDTDDVLQLTVDAAIKSEESQDTTRFGGRSVQLGVAGDSPLSALNQPVMDDARARFNTTTGAFGSDGASESRYGEVVYFLRRGTLYRRTLLIRDPQPVNATAAAALTDANPQRGPAGMAPYWTPFLQTSPVFYDKLAAINGADANATGNFYSDFDFAVFIDGFSGTPTLRFHSGPFASFDSFASTDPTKAEALGRPQTRFGFHPLTGQPVSYDGSRRWLGRFTHGETSFRRSVTQQFGYPGTLGFGADNAIGGGDDENPYLRIGLPSGNANRLELDDATGIVRDPTNNVTYRGDRYGEDVLMTNVLSFDIKVYDPTVTSPDKFVDLGHPEAAGLYSASKNLNRLVGPIPRGDLLGGDGAPGDVGVDDDSDGLVDNSSELGWTGSDDDPSGLRFLNNCFDTGWAGASILEPAPYSWQHRRAFTNRFDLGPDGRPGIPELDDDGDLIVDFHQAVFPAGHPQAGNPDPLAGQPDYDELGYPGSDDFPASGTRPAGIPQMMGIQIRIRFVDPVSGQIRDLTLQCNLIDDEQEIEEL